MRRIAVIGLGRFGMALARNLGRLGVQVIAVDRNMQLVNEVKDDVDLAVRLDSTDRDALDAQDIDKVDVCVVSIGENFEASLLTTVILRKLGVPRIVCRAQSLFHAEIFRQIGADEVIQPEISAGEQMARRLANPRLTDVIDLAEGYSLVETEAPRSWWGIALKDLGLRTKFDVNLVAIKRKSALPSHESDKENPAVTHPDIISVPRPDDLIQEGDLLMLVGSNDAIGKLPRS
ncbi:MAG: TrkA family potassium uptake protein [Rhodopirellula sp.]|nr:TrkA family potassium uptake protein [Rhodopirellula sp.]